MRLPYEVLVFVRRGDEYLILRRSEKQGGYWHSVAGAVEAGESYAEAAARELLEETRLAAVPRDLNRPYDYDIEGWEAHFAPGVERIHVESFLVEAPAGWEPTLDFEHDAYRWCAPADALERLYWPEPREVLQELAG
ncbi:MAG TPA: NUDIX domain-containing protein [Gaiellaceae bacterium]|nr:NUDIX domain-containing protein [Gaiellaceae bacterium]